jgi:hypothetical protein
VEDEGIAAVLLTPESIRTLQRKLYRKAKQDSSRLDERACLTAKNIGKPCAGKPHARFDEGGLVKVAMARPFRHRQTKETETDKSSPTVAIASSLLYRMSPV